MRVIAPYKSVDNRIYKGPTTEEAKVELHWKEQADAFRKDPRRAMGYYFEEKRLNAAWTTLTAVSEKHAGTPKGDAMVEKMHQYLANRIEQGAAIPNPEQAFGIINKAMVRGQGYGD